MVGILIIGDQEKVRKSLVIAFKKQGYEICDGLGWESAKQVYSDKYDLVIADLEGKGQIGVEILKAIKLSNRNVEIVAILTPDLIGTSEMYSCEVYDSVHKPFLLTDLVNIGKKALEKKKLADKVRNLEQIMSGNKVVS
jgi:DNA-binding NtrC family response regulator